MSRREPVKAAEVYRKLAGVAPRDPRPRHLLGTALRQQGKRDDARKEFERALALAPGYVEPLAQLASLDLERKDGKAAVDRITKQMAQGQPSAPMYMLLGNVHAATRDVPKAEEAYLKAIEIDPKLPRAYLQLGALYAQAGRTDQALAKVAESLKANPRNVGAHMLAGILYERRNEVPKAQEAYQRALDVNPRFAPAANNLAWLLAEHGGDLERALQLAQGAREVAPEDPRVSDTLGWVLYKKGAHDRALKLFAEAVAKQPNDPVMQYHYGLASDKLGDKDGARKALQVAVASEVGFNGKEEARKKLAELKGSGPKSEGRDPILDPTVNPFANKNVEKLD
jgi:Flp pilus assembly protein TadD